MRSAHSQNRKSSQGEGDSLDIAFGNSAHCSRQIRRRGYPKLPRAFTHINAQCPQWSNDTVRVYRFDNSSAEAIQAAKLVQLSTREETAFLGGVPIPAQARVMPPQTGIQRK
jgi:hypothetical protein